MAYGEKYVFSWDSIGGIDREIVVLKDGYSGDPIHRHLGQAPVLKREKNGPILGTSLEFYPECLIDQEFAEFYTSDPHAYQVEVREHQVVIWSGYITPELYSEPDVAPPYDVQVIATDCIGELKLEDFEKAGCVSLLDHFQTLLASTGLSQIYGMSVLRNNLAYPEDLLTEAYINLDYMAEKTKYDVLTYLLDTLHCFITRTADGWILLREPDFEAMIDSNDTVSYYDMVEGEEVSDQNAVMAYGSLRRGASVWPVGRMTSTVVPAKNSVLVEAPWHDLNGFVNPDMESDSGWTKSSSPAPVYDSTYHAYNFVSANSDKAKLSQTIDLTNNALDRALELTLKVSRWGSARWGRTTWCGIKVSLTDSQSSSAYLVRSSDDELYWDTTEGYAVYQQINSVSPDGSVTQDVKVSIPPLYVNEAPQTGTLCISIESGTGMKLFHASLICDTGNGWTDKVAISNNARGKGETTEIAFGKMDSDISSSGATKFLAGIAMTQAGALFMDNWADSHWVAQDFLSIASRGRALSVALPRIRTTGTLSVMTGGDFSLGRLFMKQIWAGPDFNADYNNDFFIIRRGESYFSFIEEFSWNLVEDELEISALSLPSVTLTVDSETIKQYND